MATTFLTLVNDTLRRLNEVELTAIDFPTATGFRAQVKDAINSSIQEISQREFEFPFNFTAGSLTLGIGTQEYALESDFKIADWDSFRINYDADNNHSARNLKLIDYDTFIKRFFEILIRDVVERDRLVFLPNSMGYVYLDEKPHKRAFHIRTDIQASKEQGELVQYKVPILDDYYKKIAWVRPTKYKNCKILPLGYSKKIINKN